MCCFVVLKHMGFPNFLPILLCILWLMVCHILLRLNTKTRDTNEEPKSQYQVGAPVVPQSHMDARAGIDYDIVKPNRSIGFKDDYAFYHDYHRYQEIVARIDEIVDDYPHLVTKKVIGKSHEGRDLVVLQLKNKHISDDKKTIWIDGGMHAREWISPATTMFLLEKLVKEPQELNHTDFHILPLLNPDGYEYSHSHPKNRLWRKNRANNTNQSGACIGVNLNRNWPFQWMVSGSFTDPCSDNYAGPEPFSEPESRYTAQYLLTELPELDVYLTLHSYGQKWLKPWGYTDEKVNVTEEKNLDALALAAVKALQSVHNTVFDYGSAADLTGMASGASDDWSYNRLRGQGKYSYTVELRDTHSESAYGFLLPKDQIIPSGEEMWAAINCVNRKLHGRGCEKL